MMLHFTDKRGWDGKLKFSSFELVNHVTSFYGQGPGLHIRVVVV